MLVWIKTISLVYLIFLPHTLIAETQKEVIDKLEKYGCNITVTDPVVDRIQLKKKYGTGLTELNELKDIDVVILCVGHNQFKNIQLNNWKDIFSEHGIFIDVKSLYDQNDFKNSKIKYWSL